MPLVEGYSKAAVSENISRERRAGKPEAQAIAIAMETARRAKKKAGGLKKGMAPKRANDSDADDK